MQLKELKEALRKGQASPSQKLLFNTVAQFLKSRAAAEVPAGLCLRLLEGGAAADLGTWTCPFCTFKNSNESTICQVCERGRRPSIRRRPPSIRKRKQPAGQKEGATPKSPRRGGSGSSGFGQQRRGGACQTHPIACSSNGSSRSPPRTPGSPRACSPKTPGSNSGSSPKTPGSSPKTPGSNSGSSPETPVSPRILGTPL